MIINKKIIFVIFGSALFLSLALNGWLAYLFYQSVKEYQGRQSNLHIVAFTDMFIEKVLMANKEVDFDTRLSLETAVRNLKDPQIFDQWQKFTQAKTKEDASSEVKLLLNLLIKKINN